MEKIGVIYWSGTGNTEAMAQAIAKGVGDKAKLCTVSEISADDAAALDGLILGCPAMGAEELEMSEFEPFFSALEEKISGKPVALFGSYGWGDGEWMRTWQDRVTAAGAKLFKEGLMINETPDEEGVAKCEAFGSSFVADA